MRSVTISDRIFAISAANRNQVSISTPLTCRSQSSSHTSSFTARLAANAASVPDEGRNHSPSAARPEVIRGNQRSSGIGSSVVSVRRSRSSVAFAVNVRCSERARERLACMQRVVMSGLRWQCVLMRGNEWRIEAIILINGERPHQRHTHLHGPEQQHDRRASEHRLAQ